MYCTSYWIYARRSCFHRNFSVHLYSKSNLSAII